MPPTAAATDFAPLCPIINLVLLLHTPPPPPLPPPPAIATGHHSAVRPRRRRRLRRRGGQLMAEGTKERTPTTNDRARERASGQRYKAPLASPTTAMPPPCPLLLRPQPRRDHKPKLAAVRQLRLRRREREIFRVHYRWLIHYKVGRDENDHGFGRPGDGE